MVAYDSMNKSNNLLPPISIMVPCFNHSEYIEKCLSSILDSYSGFINIIFCDDCSIDDSYDVATAFIQSVDQFSAKKFKITMLRNPVNIGVCATLNRMIDYVETEFVYLIASDDYLLHFSIDHAVKEMIRLNLDVLINDCIVIDECGDLVSESAFFSYRKGNKRNYLSRNIINEVVMNWIVPGPASLLRVSTYDKVGKYNTQLLAEDRDFYLRVLSNCIVGFSETPLAAYRIHRGNVSRSSEYLCKISKEMIDVSVKHAFNFSGLAGLYLKTYYLDKYNSPKFVSKFLRYALYRFFLLQSTL